MLDTYVVESAQALLPLIAKVVLLRSGIRGSHVEVNRKRKQPRAELIGRRSSGESRWRRLSSRIARNSRVHCVRSV